MTKAMNLLKIRDRSEQEIRLSFEKITSDFSLIEEIISELKHMKLLDDYKFARWLAQSRKERGNRGEFAIQMELKKFGIKKEISREILSEISKDDYINAAKNLLIQKVTVSKYPDFLKRKQKAYQLLKSRGFGGEVIRSAIDGWSAKA